MINILFRMGKRIPKKDSQAAQLVVQPLPGPPCTSSQVLTNPLAPSSHLLQPLPPPNPQPQPQSSFLPPPAPNLLLFFNYQKYYSKLELDCYVICLANHIHSLPASSFLPNSECRSKVRKFLQGLAQENGNTQQYENKVRAIFYILVSLIYKQKSRKMVGKTLLSDRSILRSFLMLKIPRNSRAAKYYGIILLTVTGKTHTKCMREAIVRSILANLERIDHPPTLFNLLVHLRSEKGKVRISMRDLREGKVLPFLAEGYQKFAGEYQSYYLLDYLLHLMQLFPSMAEQAVTPHFVRLLLTHLRLRSMHHPLHQQAILSFIGQGLKFLGAGKEAVLSEVRVQQGDIYTESKVAKIAVQHQQSQHLVQMISKEDYLMNFIQAVKPTQQSNVLLNCIELLLLAARKTHTVNLNLSKYLLWLLKSRISALPLDPAVSALLSPSWACLE